MGFISLFRGNDPKAACLLWIHGTYWQARNRESFSCFAEAVLARGWSAALPGYTLAAAAPNGILKRTAIRLMEPAA